MAGKKSGLGLLGRKACRSLKTAQRTHNRLNLERPKSYQNVPDQSKFAAGRKATMHNAFLTMMICTILLYAQSRMSLSTNS
jgi:hypothetical protein